MATRVRPHTSLSSSYIRDDRKKNNLLLLVELHDLLHRRRRRAVDQVVVVLDGGPRRRQGDGAEERPFPRNRATRRAGLVDVATALLRRETSLLLGAALRLPQSSVETFRFFREGSMRAALDGAPISQYNNLVRTYDRRQAVRDDERRTTFGSLRQAVLDRALRRRVQSARRLLIACSFLLWWCHCCSVFDK